MKKNLFLLMGLLALLSVCFTSCSKDDDDDNGNSSNNSNLVGGAWHQEKVEEMGSYTLHYYDVYKDDGTMREYLVWFDGNNKFTSSEYKDYDWKVEDNLYCKKEKNEPMYTSKLNFEVKDDKFYFFSSEDNTPILIATRVDLSTIQNYIDKATPAL